MSCTEKFELDNVIGEIGDFGKFQFINYILISIPLGMTAFYTISYIFTASDLNYRCVVPQCDQIVDSSIEYNPNWLKYAVPFERDKPEQCYQYSTINATEIECSENSFTALRPKRCHEFIYENEEKTILNEWNLTCSENKWKLAFVGTINTIGQFFSLPISGYLSDKYGRRFVFIFGLIGSGIFGLARSFAWSYVSFLIFEFFDLLFQSGVFSAGFILGMELVGPKYRVRGSILINVAYAIGEALLGVVAIYLTNWRTLLQVVYGPTFLIIFYLWLIPESVRWLITKGRIQEAVQILHKVAKTNKKHLSSETIDEMQKLSIPDEQPEKSLEKVDSNNSIWNALKNKFIFFRVLNCSLCFMSCTFVYYGLSITSVSIGENKYESFIYVSLIEIPAQFMTWYLSNQFGRTKTLSSTFIMSGLACIATIFLNSKSNFNLIVFLVGKLAITMAFTTLYIYTAELFPTTLRHSLFGMCSMFGRFGNMLAPQAPLLAVVMNELPMIVFGVSAILAGVLTVFMPETLNVVLPDTLEDAIEMQRTRKRGS